MPSGNFQKNHQMFNGNLFNYHAADLPSERGEQIYLGGFY